MELLYACMLLFLSVLFLGLSYVPDSVFTFVYEYFEEKPVVKPQESVADKIRKEYEKRRKA